MTEFTKHLLNVASEATELAGWRPHPKHLGFRCIEVLEYHPGGKISMHDDEDSIYTMVVLLGQPDSFSGGDFVFEPRAMPPPKHLSSLRDVSVVDSHSHGPRTVTLQRVTYPHWGGVLFDSTIIHGVTPITQGVRWVLVIELWPYLDVDHTAMRPVVSVSANLKVKLSHAFSVKADES